MKCVFSRITATVMIALLFGACAPDRNSALEPGAIRVLAPVNNDQGEYSLGVTDLKGVADTTTLSGRYARFYFSPRIVENKLQGDSPRTRFLRNSNGDYIPGNETTQQLVAIYSHMQKLAALDEELGASGVNTWPRDVGVAVRVRGAGGGTSGNNAFYDGKTDAMLFVPYTQEGLPIPINGGILAHEHFHSLFFKLVMESPLAQIHSRQEFLYRAVIAERASRETPKPGDRRRLPPRGGYQNLDESEMYRYYHLAFMRGLNEGLADFWGWMYTGDPDFIAQSLPSQKSRRSLRVQDETSIKSLPREQDVKRQIGLMAAGMRDVEDGITSYSYSLGTQFSRVMKRFTDIYAEARGVDPLLARKEVAKVLIKTLPKIKANVKALDSKYYTSNLFLDSFVSALGELKEEECLFLADVMNNSVSTDVKTSRACKREDESWKLNEQSAPVRPISAAAPSKVNS